MKHYLLDTNICIFFLKGKYDLFTKINKIGWEKCYISEITVAELLYGAACSNNKAKSLEQVHNLIEQFEILPIYNALPIFADSKALLRSKGMLVDDFDLLIGATAIQAKITLVTENLKHFNRIPNIKVENWINR